MELHLLQNDMIYLPWSCLTPYPPLLQIDEKIGRERTPTLQDRHEMLYSQAVLYEVLRVTSSPVVPHVATEDSSVGGESLRRVPVTHWGVFSVGMKHATAPPPRYPTPLNSVFLPLPRLRRQEGIHRFPQQLRDELLPRPVGPARQVHAREVPEGRLHQEARVLHPLQHRQAVLRGFQDGGQHRLHGGHHTAAALQHRHG
uniref:Uncharacterized protein n=1 Tax=Scylla olivacea TaxID=85551 RepID=A0A0P4WHK4_SCYOL